jgi:hypothetical protein
MWVGWLNNVSDIGDVGDIAKVKMWVTGTNHKTHRPGWIGKDLMQRANQTRFRSLVLAERRMEACVASSTFQRHGIGLVN